MSSPVQHPDAVYVLTAGLPARVGIMRHYRGSAGGTLCVTWWKPKKLRPSDGVYNMPVCRRCARIRGAA